MMDTLKKILAKRLEGYSKPVTKSAGVLKDVAYVAIRGAQLVDKYVPVSDALAKGMMKVAGPASAGTIRAADAVAKSAITAAAVRYATGGGPLVSAARKGYAVGGFIDQKLHISDKVARALPLPRKPFPTLARGAREFLRQKVHSGAPALSSKSASVLKSSAGAAKFVAKSPAAAASKATASVRRTASKVAHNMTSAQRAAWSAKHMTMRNATPKVNGSAKHMTMRTKASTSGPAKHVAIKVAGPKPAPSRMNPFRAAVKSMPAHRPAAIRPAPIRHSPPISRGFRR